MTEDLGTQDEYLNGLIHFILIWAPLEITMLCGKSLISSQPFWGLSLCWASWVRHWFLLNKHDI